MGVIDTLTAGYQTINRRIWILAIPIALDLFLWLGPRIVTSPSLLGIAPATLPAGYENQMATVQRVFASFNFFFLLALYMPSLVPKLESLPPGAGQDHLLGSLDTVVLAVLGLFLASLWLGCLYLALLAQVVRDGRVNLGRLLARVWLYWLRCIALIALAAVVTMVMALPSALLATAGGPVIGGIGRLLLTITQFTLIWAALYLFFAINALVINDVGPLKAMSYSIAVTRRNLMSTFGLIFLIFLIWIGTPLAWQAIARNPVGLVAGIVGNAYIGSGLFAASLIFYYDRYQRWRDPQALGEPWRS